MTMLTLTCFTIKNPTSFHIQTQIGFLEYANTDRHTHSQTPVCSSKKCPDLPALDVSPGFFTAVGIVGMCAGWDTCPLAPFDWELDSCILKADT